MTAPIAIVPRREVVTVMPGLDLYWIPLGAGTRVVQVSGKTYEALCARLQRRRPCPLYHSALVATTGEGRFTIEMTPIPGPRGPQERGVVAEGAVGLRWAGWFRVFRYEIRRWRDGVIPDIAFAVASPVRITDDPAAVGRVLEFVPDVPAPVWGRDELHAGDMWNSNSVVSWLLVQAGVDGAAGDPPGGGRAPGWDAGVVEARRRGSEPSPAPAVGSSSPTA